MKGPEVSSGPPDPVQDENLAVQLRRLLAVTRASFEQRAQLQRALNTRIVVEQAKGVLAERFQVRPEEALALLRGTARSSRMPLRELAREVLDKSETPHAISVRMTKARGDLQRRPRGGA
jgi:AmiR/NasT family two-component response regulator